jgi:hypothetical protein
MLRRGIFSAAKSSIMACLNHMSSKPSISTDTELELWIAVGLGLVYIQWKGDIM